MTREHDEKRWRREFEKELKMVKERGIKVGTVVQWPNSCDRYLVAYVAKRFEDNTHGRASCGASTIYVEPLTKNGGGHWRRVKDLAIVM